jgi:hypothetical protein
MTVDIRKTSYQYLLSDDEDQLVPASKSIVLTGDDIGVGKFSSGAILVTAGTETGTATLDVKYQVKASNGVYMDHTSITQITAAGSSITNITTLSGAEGRLVATIGGASEGDGFADVTIEFVIKS